MTGEVEIRVGSVKRGDHGVYIGRGCYGYSASPLANPFIVGKDGPRGTLIARYESVLRRWMVEDSPRGVAVRAELARLVKLARRGPLVLVCWCSPLACHGDVIARVLGELARAQA